MFKLNLKNKLKIELLLKIKIQLKMYTLVNCIHN